MLDFFVPGFMRIVNVIDIDSDFCRASLQGIGGEFCTKFCREFCGGCGGGQRRGAKDASFVRPDSDHDHRGGRPPLISLGLCLFGSFLSGAFGPGALHFEKGVRSVWKIPTKRESRLWTIMTI